MDMERTLLAMLLALGILLFALSIFFSVKPWL